VTPDPIRVDPILDAAPDPETPEWAGPSGCTDCGSTYLVVAPSWGLGAVLCLPCLVKFEVAIEVGVGLDNRPSGRRYEVRAARSRRKRI